MNSRKPMQLRLQRALKEWIKAESERPRSSQNSEVIRAIRAAQDRRSIPGAIGNINMDQGDNACC